MLAELKDKSQVTIPKAVVNELGLQRGDMFDIVVDNGVVMMVPVVFYPKAKVEELEVLAAIARESVAADETAVYDNVEDLIADLHKAV